MLCEKVRATFEENFGVYGTRKVWWKLAREEEPVARCKAESWCACWVYKARSRRGGDAQGRRSTKKTLPVRWIGVPAGFTRRDQNRYGARTLPVW